jgi:hypothetical protein
MADDEKTTPSSSDKKEVKKETLPKVDPTKVKQLNEGVDPKKTSKKDKALHIGAVSGSLPSDEEIREGADNWVFKINGMKWSTNDDTAGDNFSSFIAGAKWLMQRISNDR